jgi:hypothetical protein
VQALLTSIKAQLASAIAEVVDVQIVPAVFLFSDLKGLPVVTIQPGLEEYTEHPGCHRRERLTVTVTAVQSINAAAADASLMGSGATAGALSILDHAEKHLLTYIPAGYNSVTVTGKDEPQNMADTATGSLVVYRSMRLTYSRNRTFAEVIA